ncbi:MAG: hypothetical protein C4525_15315 [Desulfarculus sp.]|nr:MAG: hypothetical protein C4525_15315 [Desulfarculus sp.]
MGVGPVGVGPVRIGAVGVGPVRIGPVGGYGARLWDQQHGREGQAQESQEHTSADLGHGFLLPMSAHNGGWIFSKDPAFRPRPGTPCGLWYSLSGRPGEPTSPILPQAFLISNTIIRAAGFVIYTGGGNALV